MVNKSVSDGLCVMWMSQAAGRTPPLSRALGVSCRIGVLSSTLKQAVVLRQQLPFLSVSMLGTDEVVRLTEGHCGSCMSFVYR